jgi:hypothetical protein
MVSSSKKCLRQSAASLVGVCLLAIGSLGVSAKEYRLFVNDAASCRNAGVAGDVCLIAVGASTASSASSTTSTVSATTTGGTNEDCVATSWNKCNVGGGSSTASTTSSPSSTATTSSVSSSVSPPPAPSSGSVAGGDLDFGSGGGNAGVLSYKVTVTNKTTAYPFTVRQGSYTGNISYLPYGGFPVDGTSIRAWWSETAGGSPLPGNRCSATGARGSMSWSQSGGVGVCSIPNQTATLYLNFKACVSGKSDRTCTAAGATAGSPARISLSASVQQR